MQCVEEDMKLVKLCGDDAPDRDDDDDDDDVNSVEENTMTTFYTYKRTHTFHSLRRNLHHRDNGSNTAD